MTSAPDFETVMERGQGIMTQRLKGPLIQTGLVSVRMLLNVYLQEAAAQAALSQEVPQTDVGPPPASTAVMKVSDGKLQTE